MLRKDCAKPHQSKTIEVKQTASHLSILCMALQSLQCNCGTNVDKETSIMLLNAKRIITILIVYDHSE